ncbi:phosphatase PAP2 family protein [Aeromicrobium sp. IC_218]|uniref:phosphatase PAP2 family protein n=1 Tax=Aeromicrobium sp. IC_218 TaxID=2545468 RepID=UPI0013F4012F|nr:phosphatase PAP2 family protein [Aeromicrobium sp. IC_218]
MAVDARSSLRSARTHLGRGAREFALLAVLYVAYSASRTLASDDATAAHERALDILQLERAIGLDWEHAINQVFVHTEWIGVASSFFYATTHYVVTVVVLVWLYLRRPTEYLLARRAIVAASVLGLACYLLMPTAPPRLVGAPYVDVLAMNSSVGWWGADASAPRGLGHLTNELAAFPSLHAGWALWAAIALWRAGVPAVVRYGAAVYAVLMSVNIIGTGNHWVLDAVVGCALVAVTYWAVVALAARHQVRAVARDAVPTVVPRP